MNSFQKPFKFPKKLWLVISCAVFLYLLLTVPIGYAGKWPSDFTAWKALHGGYDGYIGIGMVFGLFWLVVALAFGAFVASMLGILRQLFWKSK